MWIANDCKWFRRHNSRLFRIIGVRICVSPKFMESLVEARNKGLDVWAPQGPFLKTCPRIRHCKFYERKGE